jgi:hypothetical protein
MLTPRALALGALALTCVRAQPAPAQRAPRACTVTAEPEAVARVTRDVTWLADDAREGRLSGTPGFDAAAEYVTRELTALRVEPAGTQGFLQPFTFADAPARAEVRTANVLARIPGTAPDGLTLLVGAHLDHVGRGDRASRSGHREIHNGADDNASGAAAVLELARRLQARPAARDVVLAWFGAEEYGLLGSAHLARNPVSTTRALAAMMNFDMVGRLRDCRVVVEGTESARGFAGVIARANAPSGYDVRPWDHRRLGAWGASDHESFSSRGTPVLFFFTGLHAEYHTELDDLPTLNLPGIVAVTSLAERALREVAALPAPELRRAIARRPR